MDIGQRTNLNSPSMAPVSKEKVWIDLTLELDEVAPQKMFQFYGPSDQSTQALQEVPNPAKKGEAWVGNAESVASKKSGDAKQVKP
jgi:hypothetical protein